MAATVTTLNAELGYRERVRARFTCRAGVSRLSRVFVLALVVMLAGCARQCGKSAARERARVVVSIFPIYDLTRRIAGPDADVVLIVPAEKPEHGFVPTAKDASVAAGAKLGVMVGLGLDPWMETLLTDASPAARMVKVGDRVPTLSTPRDPLGGSEHGIGDPEGEGEPGALDPHVWMDPQRAQLIVRAIAEDLGRVDGAHALAYRERATVIDKALATLDTETEARTKAFRSRGFVTTHAAFRYFAERYQLDVVAVVERIPGEAPSNERRAQLLARMREKKITALYTEPQLDAGPAKALAEEAKLPVGVLDPIGGGPDTRDYEAMIRFDVAELARQLD
jgi:ABC-type Zn uptake system ZnuABC Zn-binding protein ZnuA